MFALNAGQIIPLSWLQQTGNAPKQVMLQACSGVSLVACRGKVGSLLLLRLSICSHSASLFFRAARELNHKRCLDKDALSQTSPENPEVDPKLLICSFLGLVLNIPSGQKTKSTGALLLCAASLFPHNILYHITLITKYQQMPYYSLPSWETFLSFSVGFSSLHMPSCSKSAQKCTSPLLNPPRRRCRSVCFCTVPLMVPDGH